MKSKHNTLNKKTKPGHGKSKPHPKKKKRMPQSSSSNPPTNKFREAAKRKRTFGFPVLPNQASGAVAASGYQGGLTLEALEKHNEAVGGFTESMLEDAATTVGGTTFNTWATNLTGCTNVTFKKVHRYINANSSVQKEILAVLAAVTEVIKEKGGEGKDVQYFAVLVSSLQEADKADTKMAMSHLLSIVIKRVPVAVLQNRFSQVLKTLLEVITNCAKQEILSPLKPSLSCLASLLRVQDLSTWAETSTEHAYRAILAFITHKKPKIRKSAHKAVKVVLRGSLFMQQENCPPFHPAAPVTAQHALKLIETSGGLSNKIEVLHVLSLLKDTLGLFPQSNVKSLCEVLLRLMTLTDVVVRSSSMEVLYRLFMSKPSTLTVSAEMNGRIISALYDYQPSEKDSQPITAWLRVLESAAVCLAGHDSHLCLSHLPRLFSTCMTCLLADRSDVSTAAVATMQSLLKECVGTFKNDVAIKQANSSHFAALQKVVKTLETGLSYQFHSSWSKVLQLWATAFLKIGKVSPNLLLKCLSSMGDLRDTPHFSYKAEMDQAIGAAVKTMGPRLVLQAIPLGITGDNDNLEFPRGWLLPVIRNHVTHTELSFFTSYFLPLAAKCKGKADECSKENRIAESKAYEVLQLQIWSLLKGFCDHPTDLKQSFQGIAKILGSALSERDDLRMDVMASLRSLITCCLEKDEDKKEMARFAKNYLPILFNQFTSENVLIEGTRLAVFETLKKYLQVTDKQLIHSFLDKCLNKLGDETNSSFRNIALLDLAIAMIKFADSSRLEHLLELAVVRIESENRTLQKKAYRLLEEICLGQTESCEELLRTKMETVQNMLTKSLAKSSPSSKAPRLRCLIHVFKNMERNMQFLMSTLPEAILCTKEIGARARAAAFELIIVMADVYVKWTEEMSEKESYMSFVSKVIGGLAGSPHMVSATLLALTRIVYHYKSRLSGGILDSLIENVCMLLASKVREVVKAALGFIKVLLSAYENTVLAAHLKDLLQGLYPVAVKGNMKRLTKILYTKLLKKFGFELIMHMTEPGIHKMLKNIHKAQEKTKQKSKKEEDSDEEEESEEEDTVQQQPENIDELLQDTDSEFEDEDDLSGRFAKQLQKKKKKKGEDTWLLETGEDEIVDFMDPAATKQVLATRPKESKEETKKKGDSDRGFKMAADGRLIITKDDEDEPAMGKGGANTMSDDEDDLEDLLNTLAGGEKNKSRKRKRDVALEDDSDDEGGLQPSASKYQAGGSGIHRPVAKAKRRGFGEEYRSKKAAGDIKKVGKHDPYAYVPLNFGHLNKRKQMKVKGAFSNFVKGAKKGANKGAKARTKKGKR